MWGMRSGLKTAMAAVCAAGLISSPALAADPNSHELEERLAELEASVARAGNRKVSVSIYGQVNRAILVWDDGHDSDAYVVDNDTSSTRAGLIGRGKIKPGWAAGYRIEIEYKDGASDEVYDGGDEGLGESNQIRTRHAYWYIESENAGRLSVGQQSPATDDITLINLGAVMSDAGIHYNNGFALRLKSGESTNLFWGHLAHLVDSFRGDFVRYDTPLTNGFLISAAWGENDNWDAAIRHQGEWNDVRFASGFGYMDNTELDFSDVRGSASAIHTPSGLFLTAAGGIRNEADTGFLLNGNAFDFNDDSYFYFAQAGVSKEWFSSGKTSVYGEYGLYRNFNAGKILRGEVNNSVVDVGLVLDNEVERLGLGVEQAFEASALLLYANFNYYSADIMSSKPAAGGAAQIVSQSEVDPAARISSAPAKNRPLPVEDWGGVVVGARVQF